MTYSEIHAAAQRRYRAKNLEKAREYTRRWRAKDHERVCAMRRASAKVWMAVPTNRMKHILREARRRADKAGREFTIILDDLLPLPEQCPVLDIAITYGGTGKRGFVENSPSIDRIDHSKGYVPGNVRVISWRANRLKADATLDELKRIIRYMEHEHEQ